MFDWNDLKHLLAVSRTGSTLAAAKLLRVNQSTVHRHLATLEQSLDCQLVVRHATGYRLTSLGQELCLHAERMEENAAALARHVAASAKGLSGKLRVTCSTAVGHRLMKSGFINKFESLHPGLTVELVMTERLIDLSKGEADVAIRGGEPEDRALVGRKVADVGWGVYATRSYIERFGRPRHPRDLNHHRIIRFDANLANHRAARWLRTNAPNATVCGESNNIPSILMAVKASAGVAPLPAPVGDNKPELVCVLGPIAELSYPMYLLAHRELRKSPPVNAFFKFSANELRRVLTHAQHDER